MTKQQKDDALKEFLSLQRVGEKHIGMTDTDWLAFMGIHAGRLGIPVVAEIAGYQFDLYN